MSPLVTPGDINDVLQAVLDGACACLGEQTLAGEPKDCFISHTRPPDDCCDYLAVWYESIEPTDDFPNPQTGYDPCGHEMRMVTARLKLVRSCFPGLKDNANSPFPDALTEIQPAAEALLMDANVLWCCVNSGMNSGEFFPADDEPHQSMIVSAVPDAPRGGCAGVTVTFRFEVGSCC